MPSNSLEQEAMDRVRRMYASFDNRAPRVEKPPEPRHQPKRPEPAAKEPNEPREEKKQEPSQASPDQPKSLLDIFLKDQDQSLILLLLVMLMKDGADMNLMLALVYLLI